MSTETTQAIQQPPAKERGKKKTLLILLLLLLLLAGIAVGFLAWINRDTTSERLRREEDAIAGLIQGKDTPDIQDLLQRKVSEGMVDVVYNASPYFDENGKKGDINVQNIPGNHYSFKLTLTLDSTGEELYASQLISPGYYVQYVELDKKLAAGAYPATLQFDVYQITADSDQKIGEVYGKMTLNVSDGRVHEG